MGTVHLLQYSFTNKAFGVALCAVVIPLGLVLLPFLPLIMVLGMVTMHCRGPHPVGVAEVQQTLTLPSFAGDATEDKMLRLRIFYPAAAEERRRFPGCLLPKPRQAWLPRGAARNYAEEHIASLGVGGQ